MKTQRRKIEWLINMPLRLSKSNSVQVMYSACFVSSTQHLKLLMALY
jgi:hypothetical protein